MSTVLFPSTLKGLTWPIPRTEIWKTRMQQSISGKELRIADWSYPRHRWETEFSVLRSSSSYGEWQALVGFVNARQGSFDSFLYKDPNDSTTTGSTIGTGDSTDQTFQLSRTLGGVSEPILAPISIEAVRVGTTLFTSTMWSLSYWGSTAPGIVALTTSKPPATQTVVVDFTYAFPCRFDGDEQTFEEFLKRFMSAKKVVFTSLK